MRNHSTTLLGIAAAATLTLTACSTSSTPALGSAGSQHASSPSTTQQNKKATPLPADQLGPRLLDIVDVGSDYRVQPQEDSKHDDIAVAGCPAMEKLGGAVAGGSLDFPTQVKVSFAYSGSADSEVTEEIYTDAEDKLSSGTRTIFDAMTACPKYQLASGSTPINVTTQKVSAPERGDERWATVMTLSSGGRTTMIKQVAVRFGTILVVLSGSPGLVDTHLDKALDKALAPAT
ncbi:hypothetical protein ACGFNX_20185 [Streptomyces sp. NPDC048723]|uniref:hypothetical protein n=1 Tax=Streptomyces sp. NPDC048723 TaxID=3365589 RepID=UPI0037180B7F